MGISEDAEKMMEPWEGEVIAASPCQPKSISNMPEDT
jgi:hypothetical protein